MIPIHLIHLVGSTVTAKAKGVKIREVRCDHCGCEYIYQLRREGSGSGYAFLYLDRAGARLRAQAAAQSSLAKKLQSDQDTVPCPECGYLAASMVSRLKKRALARVLGALGAWAVGSLIGYGLCMENGINPEMLYAASSLSFLVLFGLLLYSQTRDRNAQAHRRTRAALGGKCRAMPRAELDALLNDQVDQANR